MTDEEKLNKLYDLSEKGKAEWWPDEVYFVETKWPNGTGFYFGNEKLPDQIALDLVRAEAERWLVERGWRFERKRDLTCYTPLDYTIRSYSLADALKHEMENENRKD